MEIEYKLKKILSSRTLKLTRCIALATTESITTLRQKHSSTKRMLLFSQPKESLFMLSALPIDLNNTDHQVHLCEVAVGNSLFANMKHASASPLPDGYDSYIVELNQSDENIDAVDISTKDIRNFAFFVKNPENVLPLYDIHFHYDIKLERGPDSLCDLCEQSQTVMFCHAERAALCEACDEKLHSNELTRRHKRHYFKENGKTQFMNCPVHLDAVVEYFCLECRVPVCMQCRVGSHNKSNHKIITYMEAASLIRKKMSDERKVDAKNDNSSVKENTDNRMVVRSKNNKGEIILRENNILEEEDSEFQGFLLNVQYIQSKIEQEYRRALRDLRQISMRQIQIYNADRLLEMKYKAEKRQSEVFVDLLDDTSLIRDFGIIEKVRKLGPQPDKAYKPIRIELKGSLQVMKMSEVDDREVKGMDAYIESRER